MSRVNATTRGSDLLSLPPTRTPSPGVLLLLLLLLLLLSLLSFFDQPRFYDAFQTRFFCFNRARARAQVTPNLKKGRRHRKTQDNE